MIKGHYSNSNGTLISNCKAAFVDFYFDAVYKFKDIKDHFVDKIKALGKRIAKSDTWQLAGVASLTAFLCFAITLIREAFTIPISGDFQLQGMTFIYNGYDDWHYFFKTGIFPQWDTSGMIGVSNINAYSFYYLFDPFFLILLIFPRSFLLQAQALVMMSKFVFASLAFYGFLGSFHITKGTRKIAALAYGFCGWNWFYLWFFHFQEITVFFALMLWGVEKIIQKSDLRLFVISSFLMGCTNYQFLAICLVCCFIYAGVRYISTFKQRKGSKAQFKVIGVGFCAFALGLLSCSFIVLPNFLSIQQMPRIALGGSYLDSILGPLTDTSIEFTDRFKEAFLEVFYWGDNEKYKHMYPLISLIFMNSGCYSTSLYSVTGYDNTGISMYVFAPILLMLIPSLIDAIKQKKFGQVVCFVLLAWACETPFWYYASGMFANAYGRWEIFPIAMMILFVAQHFDRLKKMPGWYLDVSAVVVAVTFFVCVNVSKADANRYSGLKEPNSIVNYLIVLEGIYLVVTYVFLRFRRTARTFKKETLFLVALEAVIMGNITVRGNGVTDYQSNLYGGHQNTVEQTHIVEDLKDFDSKLWQDQKDTSYQAPYRIFNTQASRSQNNLAMVEGYNGVGLFCSTYNYATNDLLVWSKISYGSSGGGMAGWSMGDHEKRINLETLLGVKYYLVRKDDNNVPFGFVNLADIDLDSQDSLKTLVDSSLIDEDVELSSSTLDSLRNLQSTLNSSSFSLYLNTNYVELAFPFDTYFSDTNENGSSVMSSGNSETDNNEFNYLKSAIIDGDYYSEHQDEFTDFEASKRETMDRIYLDSAHSVKSVAYRAQWDPSSEGGAYRTIHPDYSDSYMKDNQDFAKEWAKEYASSDGRSGNIEDYFNLDDEGNIVSGRNDVSTMFITPADVESTSFRNLSYYSKLFYMPSNGEPLIEVAPGEKNYVSIQAKFGYNCDFYLFGKNSSTDGKDSDGDGKDEDVEGYHVITHDQHMQNNYDKGGDWKYSRGFYTDESVYAVVGVLRETLGNDNETSQNTGTTFNVIGMQTMSEIEFENDIAKLKENPVQVTYEDANNIVFNTNYSTKKIVVLNIPYDTGWSLNRSYVDDNGQTVNEPVNYFSAQGGLIGFIDNGGENTYSISYMTPGYKVGSTVSIAAIFLAAISYAWYYINEIEIKFRKNLEAYVSLKK